MRRALPLLLAGLLVSLAGCDLIGGIDDTVAYGRVVDSASGEPLADFRVALVFQGTYGFTRPIAVTTTDADGRFRLSMSYYEGRMRPTVLVNELSWLEEGCIYATHLDEQHNTVEPQRETELTVEMRRIRAHHPGDGPPPVQCYDALGQPSPPQPRMP